MSEVPCFSCGALVSDMQGPAHHYLESSPGCWAAYGEILAREFSDPAYFARHRLTVDAYAVQHPGRPSPQSIQSVTVHLASLGFVIDHAGALPQATRLIKRLTRFKEDFEWLEPPSSLGSVTVIDVAGATCAKTHAEQVDAWAVSAWEAWASHQSTIRNWINKGLGNQ